MEYLYAYIAGAFVWAFIMSLMGDTLDGSYVLTMLIWPLAAVSILGQIIRVALGKKPTK